MRGGEQGDLTVGSTVTFNNNDNMSREYAKFVGQEALIIDIPWTSDPNYFKVKFPDGTELVIHKDRLK